MKTPTSYRYNRHSIEPLPSRVCGTDGWLYWLVCPDNGAESWYARSLADARESIKAGAPSNDRAPFANWLESKGFKVDGKVVTSSDSAPTRLT